MAGQGQEGGKIAKAVTIRPSFHFPKSQHGTNCVVNAEKHLFLFSCAFLPSSSGHTFLQ